MEQALTLDWFGMDPNALPAGTHNYEITDDNGCTAQDQITINQPNFLQASGFVSQNILGYGNANGEITAQVIGGIPPYNYSINNGVLLRSVFSKMQLHYLWHKDSNTCVIS